MEEDQEFSDGQLRHALLLHMDGTRDVEAPLIEALEQRGYLTGPAGRQRITASGRSFLGGDTPLDDDVKAVVLASQLLRHVLPLGIERDAPDGGRIVLTSIEIWSPKWSSSGPRSARRNARPPTGRIRSSRCA
jgi:hypothetical protein